MTLKQLMMKIYTIGHSTQKIEEFIQILKENEIELLIDVRSSPYSKYASNFNKKELQKLILENNIIYKYLGHKVGGKPQNKKFYYKNGEINYILLSKTVKFKEGINEIIKLSKNSNTVLMCSEENPYHCHRHHLIAQKLQEKGFKIIHIRNNGKIEKIDYQQKLM